MEEKISCMSKKISLLLYSLAPGGAERQVSILLRYLQEKFDITLVLMNDTIFYDIPDKTKVVYLERSDPSESGIKKFFKLPILGWKYKNFLRNNHFDVSLSFMSRPNYINIFAKLFGSGAKTIISERSMFSHQYSYKNLQSFANNQLVKLYNFADMIITNSFGNRDDLEKTYEIHAKMDTIYNAIDLTKIMEFKKENVDIEKRRFTFITVGRLDEGKNHLLLIEAVKNIDADLWIIGEGVLRERLQKKIDELGIGDKVKLLGRQNNPYKFLSACDCFVFSSNHEGFPNVILEALACDLPVISTDCKSGPREILAPNSDQSYQTKKIELAEFGVLVPVGNIVEMRKAMEDIMQNDEMREKYKKVSVQRAKDFDVKHILKKWEELLDERNS